MPLFRKKPIVIEAEQVQERALIVTVIEKEDGEKVVEGKTWAEPGDWLITGVKGEVYPCKPDVFEATYEVLDADSDEAKKFGRGQ